MQVSVPTLVEGANHICDAKEKAEIFNEYFCSQSMIDDSCALLPSDILYFQTTVLLSDIYVSEREINDLLKSVDIGKACGHDGIGNRIIKMCADGIANSFTSLVNYSLLCGDFPDDWKLANVTPIFKKDDRQSKVNYRPISLLSLSKIVEKIVFIRLYNFLLEIGFLNPLQSGFRPGDSTVNQLTYLVHKIYAAFEQGKEVRMVFLDISKAFDKVWHNGLIYKLESLGVRDPLLSWFKSYLINRKQRVVIDGQTSQWRGIDAGVPQGSVLGPLLFLIYINDITENLESDCLLYADDTSLFDIVDSPHVSSTKLNNDLYKIKNWASRWLVTINPTKTECITFSVKRLKPYHPDLFYEGKKIVEVSQHTHLGVTLSSNLSWRPRIIRIYEKTNRRLNLFKGIQYKVSRGTLNKLYRSLIRPLMEYADTLWDGCTDSESDLLESVQYEAAKIVTGAMKGTSKQNLMHEVGWEDMKTRRSIHKLIFYFKIVKNLVPNYLKELLSSQVFERSRYSLRNFSDFTLFAARTERFKKSFFPSVTKLWNELDRDVRNIETVDSFKKALFSIFHIPKCKTLFNFSLDRYSSVIHTRLRLDTCALNFYLFKIGCKPSPACLCGFAYESVNHYFLHCPIFAAPRLKLLSSAAQTFADRWPVMSESQIIKAFLFGSLSLSENENVNIFYYVQCFIKESKRFQKREL